MFSLECLEYVSAKDTEPTWDLKGFNDPHTPKFVLGPPGSYL